MDFHLVIPNPAGFDVLTPPVPVVARAGQVGVMFEVSNRSPSPLGRQRLYLAAKGGLHAVLAFEFISHFDLRAEFDRMAEIGATAIVIQPCGKAGGQVPVRSHSII